MRYYICQRLFRSERKLGSLNYLNGQEDIHWSTLNSVGFVDHCTEPASIENVVCLLQKARKIKNLAYAKHIHMHSSETGLDVNGGIGNYVVPMSIECGSMADAHEVFNRLVHRGEHSWTALVVGYIQCGQSRHALNLYQKMCEDSVHVNCYTFTALLKACAQLKDIEKGRQLHWEVTRRGFQRDLFLGSTLIDMYAKCGYLQEAQEVFDLLPSHDVVSWNALICGYGEIGPAVEALRCFQQMQLEGIPLNNVTFICSLKACSVIGAIDVGREIHNAIAMKGFGKNIFVGNALIDMYAKCGALAEARSVLEKLPVRNVVSWTALIGGYVQHGCAREALISFEQMQLEGIIPDAATFVCSLKACGSTRSLDKGKEIHVKVAHKGLEKDILVANALVDMYSKCGSFADSQEIFDKLSDRNIVSWTSLIAGYAEHGLGHEALECYARMQIDCVTPNIITYMCLVKACGSIAAIDRGRELHKKICQRGYDNDLSIGNTLIDMYAKCGSLDEARSVFDKLPVKNAATWTAMIGGYSVNYEGNMAVQCFADMQELGEKPDAITFLCLLVACSRANLMASACHFFKLMQEVYELMPTLDHCNCMVDLFARSGNLYEAEMLLEVFSIPPSNETWKILLSACKTYGDTALGLNCFKCLAQSDNGHAASYVLMANIYGSIGG